MLKIVESLLIIGAGVGKKSGAGAGQKWTSSATLITSIKLKPTAPDVL